MSTTNSDDAGSFQPPAAAETSQLVSLMTAMADGEHRAVFAFVERFGLEIGWLIHQQLRSYGRHDLLRDEDEMAGLVQTAAFEILDRAGSWDSAGAPPWVWAGEAIRAAVVREIGHARVALDDEHRDLTVPARRETGTDLDLASMARRHRRLGLLREVMAAGSSERDREVAEQYLIQQALGDPSPSHTVAVEFGLTPVNVRQIVRRVRSRARLLIAEDHRYRDLEGLGWLAA